MRSTAPALLLSTLALVTGCTVTGHLYPLQGPLAQQHPAPIYPLTLTSFATSSGNISVSLQDGEICSGRWANVPQDDPSANQMAAQWDSVYGAGFFVANVLGNQNFARASLTGNKGTTLNIQFYLPPDKATPGTNPAKGIAEDNKGNLFKLTLGGLTTTPVPAPPHG